MIQYNNHLSPLPFVNTLAEQAHRQTYAYGQIFPLYTEANFLLPFQIIRTKTATISLTSVYIRKAKNDTVVADITNKLQLTGLVAVERDDYNIWVYPALLPFDTRFDEGQYYLVLTDNNGTCYSEVFTAVHNINLFTKIEWWDEEDFVFDDGCIVYKLPTFRNKVYLPTEVGMPDYTFNEEGEERDGFFFPQKQLSEKTYRCTFLAPEYLCDVMRTIRMADNVRVTDKYGRVYMCDTFLITPKWQPQGYLASVDCEFQTNTVMKKVNYARYIVNNGDYNNDYDNDYDINNNE